MNQSQAAAFPIAAQIDMIPLIKSPAFRVPPPVELPPDIHPLPADVTAYFVYPHTLEAQVLQTLPATVSQLQASHSARLHLLASYADSKERARKARLNQLAPGWGESAGGVLEPVRRETVLARSSARAPASPSPPSPLSPSAHGGSFSGPGPGSDGELLDGAGGPRPGPGNSHDRVESPTDLGTLSTFDENEREQLEALVAGLAAMDSDRAGKNAVGDLF